MVIPNNNFPFQVNMMQYTFRFVNKLLQVALIYRVAHEKTELHTSSIIWMQ